MSQALIRKAFESRLKTWADAQTPAIPVAWENVPFTPPVGRYVRAFLLPLDTQYLSLDQVCKTWRGIFQVSFCMPIGTGAGSVESLTASLSSAFLSYFAQDSIAVYLLRPFSAATPIQEPDRFTVPVSAAYRVDTIA